MDLKRETCRSHVGSDFRGPDKCDELEDESLRRQLSGGLRFSICYNAVMLGALFLCLLTDDPLRHLSAVAGLFIGAAAGSFSLHLHYRVVRDIHVFGPKTHCPLCRTAIKAVHNVPIVGWLILRGRCASCKARIPLRYLLSELCGGALGVFAGLALNSFYSPSG